MQLIKRHPNVLGNLGLPSGIASSWNSFNNNWNQSTHINLIPTANPMVETSWPQEDTQWNIHNSGASTQPIGGYATQPVGSFQLVYAPPPVYVSQLMNVP